MALGGALVGGKDLGSAGGEFFGGVWGEGLVDGGGDFPGVAGEQRASSSVEVFDEGLEVFHVGTEDQGFVGQDGLGGVLTSGGEEGFPDDDHIGVGGPGG